ncbi:hypothetical protein [Bradyrhizobium guangdongense]|uniref:hypothetical protein n=1 Tax=Bradyrhizobium guangdongense TaxID=1325090 RepID=UPI0013E8BD84|nr:hypothetical protein [Bradyrhizobium guangdongense]
MMRFEGRAGGESVRATMPWLAGKGHRRAATGASLGANAGDFTLLAELFPAI